MNPFLQTVAEYPDREFVAGDFILRQGDACTELHVLLEGDVEVIRDDVRVAKISESGSVFGEMSLLLGGPCTASVRALGPVRVASISRPREFLASSADASLHIAELLAHRIDALNRYLVDVKHQYEGHDHLGMVDAVLDALMHRPRKKKA